MMKKQLSVMVDKDSVDMFQRLYPQCMTRFVELAIKMACSDKDLFMKIYFSHLEVK